VIKEVKSFSQKFDGLKKLRRFAIMAPARVLRTFMIGFGSPQAAQLILGNA